MKDKKNLKKIREQQQQWQNNSISTPKPKRSKSKPFIAKHCMEA